MTPNTGTSKWLRRIEATVIALACAVLLSIVWDLNRKALRATDSAPPMPSAKRPVAVATLPEIASAAAYCQPVISDDARVALEERCERAGYTVSHSSAYVECWHGAPYYEPRSHLMWRYSIMDALREDARREGVPLETKLPAGEP